MHHSTYGVLEAAVGRWPVRWRAAPVTWVGPAAGTTLQFSVIRAHAAPARSVEKAAHTTALWTLFTPCVCRHPRFPARAQVRAFAIQNTGTIALALHIASIRAL